MCYITWYFAPIPLLDLDDDNGNCYTTKNQHIMKELGFFFKIWNINE